MIVYVESNFVLEMVLEQEECSEAEAVLAAAERNEIRLVIPSFSIAEPFSTLNTRTRSRRQLNTTVNEQARQLQRSSSHAALATEIQSVAAKLIAVEGHEISRLEVIVGRTLACCELVPFSSALHATAISHSRKFGLNLSDAVVLASVTTHLSAQSLHDPKVFISRNWKDFDEDIRSDLKSQKCVFEGGFRDALKHLSALA